MTKKELIDLLWEYPDDMEICIRDFYDARVSIKSVELYKHDNWHAFPTFYAEGIGYYLESGVILLR